MLSLACSTTQRSAVRRSRSPASIFAPPTVRASDKWAHRLAGCSQVPVFSLTTTCVLGHASADVVVSNSGLRLPSCRTRVMEHYRKSHHYEHLARLQYFATVRHRPPSTSCMCRRSTFRERGRSARLGRLSRNRPHPLQRSFRRGTYEVTFR